MRPIPAEVQTLLKSRSMIGPNKPAYEVTIEGVGTGYDWQTATAVYTPYSPLALASPSMAELSDGRVLLVFVNNGILYQGYAPDIDTVISQNDSVTSVAQIFASVVFTGLAATIFTGTDGSLNLVISYHQKNGNKIAGVELYKSALKDGSDWTYCSTLQTGPAWVYDYAYSWIGSPVFVGNRWILPHPYWFNYYAGYLNDDCAISISEDYGHTWTVKSRTTNGFYSCEASRNIGFLPDGSLWHYWGAGQGGCYANYYQSTDNGDTWVNVIHERTADDTSRLQYSRLTFSDSDYLYQGEPVSGNLRFYRAATAPTDTRAGWELFLTSEVGSGGFASNIVLPLSKTIIMGGSELLGLEKNSASIPVKSISINRDKNMAASLEISLTNTGGEWSPDGTTHPQILWPNTEIVVRQGYGADANLVKTFTGLVDSVTETSFPQEIRVICRDYLKKALDQIVSMPWEGGTSHNLTYWDKSPEWIFADLCSKAGIATDVIEETGIVINEHTFSWESYMDAFQWLAEASGNFEVYASEDGKVGFRRDAVPADASPVYTFTEGIDLISLSYQISDQDVYTKVAVYGKTPNTTDAEGNTVEGHVVFAARDYVSRNYYKVFTQKYLKIDAGTAAGTVDACQAVADQAEALMRSRVRTVTFAAVAVPWLQVGDVIKVFESSSKISELYRVTSISSNMDAENGGYTMTIVCYHHGAA